MKKSIILMKMLIILRLGFNSKKVSCFKANKIDFFITINDE